MADPRDRVELSVLGGDVALPIAGQAQPRPTSSPSEAAGPRTRFLSLWFSCANVYGRAYRAADGSCYEGRCPKCGKSISFPIGSGGTNRRMFEVSCR